MIFSNPISSALDFGKTLVERLIPDKAAQADALLKLEQLHQNGDLAVMAGQNEIAKIEAANASPFISGWRPAVGWICAAGLGTQFLVNPLFTWIAALVGHPTPFPNLDMGTLVTLLVGMLGLGGLRTVEKLQDAEGNR